jgi:hypothetical protein
MFLQTEFDKPGEENLLAQYCPKVKWQFLLKLIMRKNIHKKFGLQHRRGTSCDVAQVFDHGSIMVR